MSYLVGYRKKDGSVGLVRISDVDSHLDARQSVMDHLGATVAFALLEEKND